MVEWKPQPVDEVGDENYPLVGLRVGTICPSVGSRWATSLAKYPASQSCVMSFSLIEDTIHLPCAPDPNMVECFLEVEKMRAWALELEGGWAEEEEGVG